MATIKQIEIPVETVIRVNNIPVKCMIAEFWHDCKDCFSINTPEVVKRIVCKADKRTDNINVYFTEV
jgi:hypothetical protein